MPDQDAPPRAALFVDFDNVFMALLRWDERAAYAFGERPDHWLAWLEGREAGAPTARRTLIRRCYLNPGGYHDFQPGRAVARYRAARDLRNRTYYSEFRAAFVRAGFDVVDCPPIAYLKNTADMKMALDIREALDHRTVFDEFVLLSGDSDFLPALARLRAHDRRITILAQETAKPAYLAAADVVVGLEEFAHDGMGNLPIAQFPTAIEPPRPDPMALRGQVMDWVRDAVARSAAGALRLTEIGQALSRSFPALRATDYAGAGGLGPLIEEARDRRLSLSGPPSRRWVYDADRGPPPGDLPPGVEDQPGLLAEPEEVAPETVIEVPEPEPAGIAEAEPPADARAAEAPERDEAPVMDAEPPADQTPAEDAQAAVLERDPAQAMAEAALLVRDLLWGSRDAKGLQQDLPAFSPAEIGFVLAGIAARQPLEDLPAAATAIAGTAAEQGMAISAREVTAVLRWLLRGYAKLNEAPAPAPDAAQRLGRVLYATLVNTLRGLNEQLSDTEKDALRGWAAAEAAQAPP